MTAPPNSGVPAISPERRAAIAALSTRIAARKSLPLGILGGLAGAIVGAIGWATLTAATGYQIGYAAIGVAFLTGFGVRRLGNGGTQPFGVAGATLALAGCAAGNLAAALIRSARADNVPYAELAQRLDWTKLPDVFVRTFQPMDLIFYGFAVYFGYRYSLRRLTKDELATLPA